MVEKSDRKELERRLEQAKRMAAITDPVTNERLQKAGARVGGAASQIGVGARPHARPLRRAQIGNATISSQTICCLSFSIPASPQWSIYESWYPTFDKPVWLD